MPVRNTANDDKVALFDSTEGMAFGPVFDSEQEADDFLAYAEEVHGIEDVRICLTPNYPKSLQDLHRAFIESQEAGDDDS